MNPFQFKCLYCDNWTPSADTHNDCRTKAEAAGWSWAKALVCPECLKKIADGVEVRSTSTFQLDMD